MFTFDDVWIIYNYLLMMPLSWLFVSDSEDWGDLVVLVSFNSRKFWLGVVQWFML